MTHIPQEKAFKPASEHHSKRVPLAATAPSMRGGMYPAAGGIASVEEIGTIATSISVSANTVVVVTKGEGVSVFTSRSLRDTFAFGQSKLSIGLAPNDSSAPLSVSAPASPREQLRVPGEIALFRKIMERWGFGDRDAAILLGYEGPHAIVKLYSGVTGLASRDEKDRVRAILRIATDLHALFRDETAIREWLREPKVKLDGRSACELMLEGSMENLIRVKHFVALSSGR